MRVEAGKMSSIPFTAVLVAVSLFAGSVCAAPTVTVETDRDEYVAGEVIEVGLHISNAGEATQASVYFGLIDPDGAIYAMGQSGWQRSIEPWILEVYLPSSSSISLERFMSFEVPCEMPRIAANGHYSFAAALTRPDAPQLVLDLDFAPFTVREPIIHEVFVDADLGDDAGNGTASSPFRTISHALEQVEGSRSDFINIRASAGKYAACTNGEVFPLLMEDWVMLSGDDPETTVLDADEEAYHVVCIDGVGATMISGVTIKGGLGSEDYSNEANGGGVYCSHSCAWLENNIITSNAARYGGGVFCADDCYVVIINSRIVDNSATHGGGIECHDSHVTVFGNEIAGNTAARYGGGIYSDGCWGSIKNNMLASNSANWSGGGIYYKGPGPSTECNTVVDNWAQRGGGICGASEPPLLRECIIWGNRDNVDWCITLYCCVEYGEVGGGNINADPMFVPGPLGNYYLGPQSPCIDAGGKWALESGLADRTTRPDGLPDGGILDMGFHYLVVDSREMTELKDVFFDRSFLRSAR